MKATIGKRILHFPLTKIVVGMIVIIGIYNVSNSLLADMLYQTPLGEMFFYFAVNLIPAILCVAAYFFLYKFYEKRKISELSTQKIGIYLGLGILLGAVLQSLTILVIYLSAAYSVETINTFKIIIPAILLSLSTAVFEEILFRGIVFRIMEEKLGSIISLLISALFFGFLHLANPGSSIVSALAITLEAGILLGVAYILTRNLWFPIAIHFAWNFTQSGIFGALTSGSSSNKTLLVSKISGNELLTGGAFGPEASIQAILFCSTAGIIMLMLCKKQNKLIKPFWK